MGFYEIGFAAFIVAIVIGQFLLQRASAQLSIEDRAKLVDLHGGLNTYWLLILYQ